MPVVSHTKKYLLYFRWTKWDIYGEKVLLEQPELLEPLP